MKRSFSDSDSDDGFDQHSEKYAASSSTGHGSDRKRRRGVIEKRRRDRINASLSELRRLVPAAFEKQGSAKLEKAEILQMTVDHLKMLHAKGLNNYNFDPTTLAMDYRSVGFRECMTEVSRYLMTAEGVDIQDPLRLRIMAHLQCYSAQREVASKHASLNPSFQGSGWCSMSSHPSWNAQYATNTVGPMANSVVHPGGQTDHSQLLSTNSVHTGGEATRVHQHSDNHGAAMRLSSATGSGPASASQLLNTACPSSQPSASVLPALPQVHSQFPVSLSVNSVSMLSPAAGTHGYNSTTSFPLCQTSGVRPYRPWGSELAF